MPLCRLQAAGNPTASPSHAGSAALLTGSGLTAGGDRHKLRPGAPSAGWLQVLSVQGTVQLGTGDERHGARITLSANTTYPPPGCPPMRLDQDLNALCLSTSLVDGVIEAILWTEPPTP